MSGGGKGGEIMMKVGPRGGSNSGTGWDDLALGDIKIIYISHGSDLINSIQTAHSDSGDGLKLSQKHGGDGDKFDMVNVDVEGPISWISGYYGSDQGLSWGPVVIRSLTIGFRSRSYGPFGLQTNEGTLFHYRCQNNGGSVCGFHGRADKQRLCSIGVYVRNNAVPSISPSRPVDQSPFIRS
eukprot:TRINITY_DN2000_c0_g1_i3.p1 TRINITY_DN2000_c0_g1~~TRINITY_DN2000_c0_g1_i3.p1  ORF type:complete len:182 (+),score=13.58 TRINITY_DN2000_c0_g1_i3:212-757(+)